MVFPRKIKKNVFNEQLISEEKKEMYGYFVRESRMLIEQYSALSLSKH